LFWVCGITRATRNFDSGVAIVDGREVSAPLPPRNRRIGLENGGYRQWPRNSRGFALSNRSGLINLRGIAGPGIGPAASRV